MSHRLIYQTLSDLARHVQALDGQSDEAEVPFDLFELDKQIKRLSRELYKANTLTETQTEQTQRTVEGLQKALDTLLQERQSQAARERDQIAQAARLDVVKALIPVLDGVESGIFSGAAQLKPMLATTPDVARILLGWLNGQRLLRERLLKLLEAEGVLPIPTVGQPFDPYRHIAVKTAADPAKAPGLILREERRGYIHGENVLRYADVIVNKLPDKQG